MCVGLSDDRPGEPITPQIAHICAFSGLGKLSSLTVNCVFGHLEISPRVLCKMLLRFCFCGKDSAQAMESFEIPIRVCPVVCLYSTVVGSLRQVANDGQGPRPARAPGPRESFLSSGKV